MRADSLTCRPRSTSRRNSSVSSRKRNSRLSKGGSMRRIGAAGAFSERITRLPIRPAPKKKRSLKHWRKRRQKRTVLPVSYLFKVVLLNRGQHRQYSWGALSSWNRDRTSSASFPTSLTASKMGGTGRPCGEPCSRGEAIGETEMSLPGDNDGGYLPVKGAAGGTEGEGERRGTTGPRGESAAVMRTQYRCSI